MNLTNYPTPRSIKRHEEVQDRYGTGTFDDCLPDMKQLEREAAAWKAVAEKLAAEMRDLAWLAGPAGSVQPNTAELELEAFDALKSQLEGKS